MFKSENCVTLLAEFGVNPGVKKLAKPVASATLMGRHTFCASPNMKTLLDPPRAGLFFSTGFSHEKIP
jgi:hypothetical protein